MKIMSGPINVVVVSAGLVLVTGCAVQNGALVYNPNPPIYRAPNVVVNSPADNYQIQRLKQKAVQGDAVAQCTLGSCYASGRGVARNYMEAVKWYRLSAERGYATAQNRLGVCYAGGRGVARNDMLAVKWYRLSADQGNAFAQNNLGACYASGHGVAPDYVEAVKWYHLSAEQGYAAAQNHLGVCYASGRGVARDDMEAVKWYRKAAAQGNLAAQNNLRLYENKGVVVTAPEPNNPKAPNPPSAEPIDSTAQNPFTVDDIKAASNAGTKPDFLISQINESNSIFSPQDIAAAQQANVDPAVIECMKSHSN